MPESDCNVWPGTDFATKKLPGYCYLPLAKSQVAVCFLWMDIIFADTRWNWLPVKVLQYLNFLSSCYVTVHHADVFWSLNLALMLSLIFSGNVKLFLSLIFLFVLDIYTLLQHKLLLLAAAGMQTSLGSQLGLWSAAGPLWAVTNVSKKSYCRCYVDAIWVCLWRRLALTSSVNLLVMCIFLLKFHYFVQSMPL